MASLRNNAAEFCVETTEPFTINLAGRLRWALETLIKAGNTGCTSIENPAPRWSAYVHGLRSMGVTIETIHERQGGGFPGTHDRNRLTAQVRQVQRAIG